MPKFDLDVDSPDKVPGVLRRAAQAYYESATELDSSWQESGPGRPWIAIAKKLDAVADELEKRLKNMGF